ncbi:hypothetical protein FSARC_11689 [Fusarium sarcochroum]|uniref:Uncharacterized protein n=1 Tax=Fusarium sarcochroum TaxID=1208366 RepID=A0A8H4TE99_9HYPO|nr:hypothetical protein FSARC_11689 [Fusarium sarcochroum]
MLLWVPEDEDSDPFLERGDQLCDLISNDPRAEKSVKQLQSVVVTGQSDWLIHGLLPHFSSNLTAVRLSQDCSMGASDTSFTDLSRQCPNLKSLSINQTLATSEDLEEACKVWGDTLERLDIASIEDTRDWISPIIPAMKVLKALKLGSGCCVRAQEVKAIALAASPLEEIDLGDIYLSAAGDADEMDQALESMIDAHSPTLHILRLYGTDVGQPVMQSCKKARSLHTINLLLSYSPQASGVDDLLDACAGLDNFTGWFKDYSARWGEWEARRKTRGEAEQKRLRRDPTIYGLGT